MMDDRGKVSSGEVSSRIFKNYLIFNLTLIKLPFSLLSRWKGGCWWYSLSVDEKGAPNLEAFESKMVFGASEYNHAVS